MSRTISQIYSEAIYVRNNYLQITELDSGRTKSKMSILNLMTYVMSVLIYSYETILDVFQVNIAKLIKARVNGTPAWYVTMALKFQFNPLTSGNDAFGFNEETYSLEYETIDATHKIITQAAWQEYAILNAIILKVNKDNTNSLQKNSGAMYMPLTNNEMAAFKEYVMAFKFVGAKVYCISLPHDIVTVKSNDAFIYYDDTYTTAESIFNNVKTALIEYAKSLEYNNYIYYQAIIDVIQNVPHVINIDSGTTIEISSFDSVIGQYSTPTNIIGQFKPVSGFIGFIDKNNVSTINMDNLKFKPISEA